MTEQIELFAAPNRLPEGFTYQPEFISVAEETDLVEMIRTLPLQEAQYKEWTAKRRIVSYGGRYDFSQNELLPAGPIPSFLQPLRERMAACIETPVEDLQHALIAEYRPGTQLGWHRDVPNFEAVVGLSLHGRARMRLRTAFALELQPRSVYAMIGAARWNWQHAISPTTSLRYSITFRSLAEH